MCLASFGKTCLNLQNTQGIWNKSKGKWNVLRASQKCSYTIVNITRFSAWSGNQKTPCQCIFHFKAPDSLESLLKCPFYPFCYSGLALCGFDTRQVHTEFPLFSRRISDASFVSTPTVAYLKTSLHDRYTNFSKHSYRFNPSGGPLMRERP